MGGVQYEVSNSAHAVELTPILSSSGKPYTTPAGHTPKWVESVSWHSASAFDPPSYTSLVSGSSAVVSTLGILLEDAGYKAAVRSGNVFGLLKAFGSSISGGNGNPLKTPEERRSGYDGMNKEAGQLACSCL